MKFPTINIPEPDRKELRAFGLVMAGAIGGLFGLILPRLFNGAWPIWPWSIASLFLLLGIVAPQHLRPVFEIWMRLGYLIGRVTTPIILGLIFFTIVTPIGLYRRVFSKDPMCRRLDPSTDSYKIDSQQPDLDNMERPF
jgi:hypothetical protein